MRRPPSCCRRRTYPGRRNSPDIRSRTRHAPPFRSGPSPTRRAGFRSAPDLASSDLGFERLEPFLHRLKILALPDPAHAGGRNRMAELAKRVGDADLAISRPVQRKRDDDRLDVGRRAVLQDRVAPRQLLQRQFAAGVVKLLEAIETVARVAHHFAGLADIAELPGQLQQPYLGADDLLFLGHRRVLSKRRGRALRTPTTPRPASASASAMTPIVRLSLNYCTRSATRPRLVRWIMSTASS